MFFPLLFGVVCHALLVGILSIGLLVLILRWELLLIALGLNVEVLLRNTLIVFTHISLRSVVLRVRLLWVLLLLVLSLTSMMIWISILVLVDSVVCPIASTANQCKLDDTHSSAVVISVERICEMWMSVMKCCSVVVLVERWKCSV